MFRTTNKFLFPKYYKMLMDGDLTIRTENNLNIFLKALTVKREYVVSEWRL